MTDSIIGIIQLAERKGLIPNPHITDQLFNFIEQNENALYLYKKLCEAHGKDSVNTNIGKAIKKYFKLEETDTAVATSSLIKTYTVY